MKMIFASFTSLTKTLMSFRIKSKFLLKLLVTLFSLSKAKKITAHAIRVLALLALNNGTKATGSADNTIKIWNSDYQVIQTLQDHTGWVTILASYASDMFLSGAKDHRIIVWKNDNGEYQKLNSLKVIYDITCLLVSDYLFIGSDASLRVHNKDLTQCY
jgi:WD40 repeat protein